MADHDKTTTEEQNDEHLGLAGNLTRAFINSPLSPLLFVAMLFLGLIGLAVTPRQEDPQISVPMVDIFVQYPGADASQVASLATQPLERIMSEIPGVEHVYSASQRGQAIVTVQFFVGEELGPSIVKVHDKIQSNMDKIPPGVRPPLVKPKGIDDVPVVTLTLWSPDPQLGDAALRKLALDILQEVKELPDTGQGFVVGGSRERVKVNVYPQRLSGFGISLDQVAQTIRTANAEQQAGTVEARNTFFNVYTGSFLRSAEDVSRLVVGTRNEVPVYVRDVAQVSFGPAETTKLVEYYTAPAGDHDVKAEGVPAVTLAVAKKEGSNGVQVAASIIDKVESLKGVLIPSNVNVSVTRNYGETADDKVNELIMKLFKATGFVFLLVLFAFVALRPALVVLLVIPVVILFTVFAAFLMGYTIDRVSLFALIFSIGILVDDAIVVVENIYRRWLESDSTSAEVAVDAVREVGNPTIIATFTVVAALLPMGFVRGMMGPYMEPIPALGSVAMIVSLLAAFMFTPWWALRLKPSKEYLHRQEKREHAMASRLDGLFRRVLIPLIDHRGKRLLFRLALWGALFLAMFMFYTTAVTVKMLPLDNKPEFSLVINMPEGTALPVTANLTRQIADAIRTEIPEVTALQTYVGTARPFDFNGMVRHYYLRDRPWQAEIQVQLTHKTKRDLSSHELAVMTRELITGPDSELRTTIRNTGARIAVVEMPPGPPVLQTVVAEIHGPSGEARRAMAAAMAEMFEKAENLDDVYSYVEEPSSYWRFEVDREKAVRRGISVDTINRNVTMAMGGHKVGDIKQANVLEPTNIVIQVPLYKRSEISILGDLPIPTAGGQTIPLAELGRFVQVPTQPTIYHKDLRPVEYVTAESVGRLAAPIYGMFQVEEMIREDRDYEWLRDAMNGEDQSYYGYFTGPPPTDARLGFQWAGEWTVTYETFRDMGIAFAAALVLIYILVVWEFGNFRVPLLIMAPIPLTLLGIIPGHMLFGAEFTATSMIGWIALAGIIVRNSILLVDFAIHAIRDGTEVKEAVIQACTTRTRPIMITALALVAGSSVILGDPIFKGMAISLAFGVMVSTILTLIVIPLGCIAASESLISLAFPPGHGGPGGNAPVPPPGGGPSPQPPGTPVSTVRAQPKTSMKERVANVSYMALFMLKGAALALVGLLKRLMPGRGNGSGDTATPPGTPEVSIQGTEPASAPSAPASHEQAPFDSGDAEPVPPAAPVPAPVPPPEQAGSTATPADGSGPESTDAGATETARPPESEPPPAAPQQDEAAPPPPVPMAAPQGAPGPARKPAPPKVPGKKRISLKKPATPAPPAVASKPAAPRKEGGAKAPPQRDGRASAEDASGQRKKRRGIRLKRDMPGLGSGSSGFDD